MKIAVVAPEPVPVAVGGAERLCDGLVAAIVEHTGHECDLIKIPSPEYSFRQLIDSYEAFAELDLSGYDHIISTKYPSWMVRHPSHWVYMLHTLRGLYDAYGAFGLPTELPPSGGSAQLSDLITALRIPPGTRSGWRTVLGAARTAIDVLGDGDAAFAFPGPLIRRVVHWLDTDALHATNVGRYAAISRTVAERRDYFPSGAAVEILLPPTNLPNLRRGGQKALFTASRLDGAKRIDLLIDAMKHVESPVEFRIAGTGPDEQRLKERAAGDSRIVFLGRISEDQLMDEYSDALAVPFVPFDEDFGLVTLEAQLSAKPVITCRDSGGVTEMVTDKVSGRIVEPKPEALGRAIDQLAASPALAWTMGEAGRRTAREVTWGKVVAGLVPGVEAPTPFEEDDVENRREMVLVLSTYAAWPARHGGQIRLNRLVRGLSQRFDVELVVLDHTRGDSTTIEIMPGVRQTLIPTSSEHERLEWDLAAKAPIPIGDIAASLYLQHTPVFIDTVRAKGREAVGAVLEQPYLAPALERACPHLPFVYESQNAETEMKHAMLDGSENGPQLEAVVRAVESYAVRRAALVSVCATDDRADLHKLGPTLADWTLVQNGTDVVETPFITGSTRETNRQDWVKRYSAMKAFSRLRYLAVFVGSYHPPNLEAAERLVRLAPELPEVGFVLAGSQGSYFSEWSLPQNVIVTGMVSDGELRRLLGAADVALNPIMSGGGTNLKLIEYFAAGVPVVSTALGIRGTNLRHGEELLVADVDGFGPAIAEVIERPADAAIRAKRARQVAEESYDWHPIGAAFAASVADAFGVDMVSEA